MTDVSYAVRSVQKRFGAVQAIQDATFEVERGTVHGVIGKNGAGKSVLMNIVSGVMPATAGELEILGESVDLDHWNSREAQRRGVALIPQEPPRLPHLNVEDYLFLGDQSATRFGILHRRLIRRKVAEINERLGLGVRPSDPMVTLPIEVQQLLAFGKAVFLEQHRVILLDEITASLTGERRTSLLRELRELAADRSFTLISHRINEIMSTCDRVTVMRDGVSVETLEVAETTAHDLAQAIVGEGGDEVEIPEHSLSDRGEVVLSLAGVDWEGGRSQIDLEVREREVIGLAGVQGSGMEDLLLGLAGLRRLRGDVEVDGRRVRLGTPRRAAAAGIAYLPKKREEYATIPRLSVLENLMLPPVVARSGIMGLWRRSKYKSTATTTIHDLQVKPQRLDVSIDTLSGGNRQKVMLGRLRTTCPRVYVLDEPTRGVDIATKPALLRLVRQDLAQNSAILVTSEAEEELIEICDRVLVFVAGELVEEIRSTDPHFNVRGIYRATQGVDHE